MELKLQIRKKFTSGIESRDFKLEDNNISGINRRQASLGFGLVRLVGFGYRFGLGLG